MKMDLGTFLADDSLGGSWADEEVDMSSIGVAVSGSTTAAPVSQYSRGDRDEDFGGDFSRRERTEYPVPDAPPFRARVANLPYEVAEDELARFFEDRLQARDIVEDIKLPIDNMTGRLKGFAFVTFTEKAALEEALRLTLSEYNGRKIYVNVAAPQKQDVFDLDWRSGRTGPLGQGRREEPDLDWGAARSGGPLRDNRDRERRPRRDEPDLDWGSARQGNAMPASERRPRREEAELDWGSARQGNPLPARERRRKEEPDLDWSAARTGAQLPPREKRNDEWNTTRAPRKAEKEFDWKRGQKLEPREKPVKKAEKAEKDAGPQKSSYDVLALDSDEEVETKMGELSVQE